MDFDFRKVEEKWRGEWEKNGIYKVTEDPGRPKYYVLDMFPYPSGAGLHVGHPLGYVASDIYARYKRLKGFNVLHPMGYDAFGLPAEQYAIETGTPPEVTTEKAIKTYRSQLDKIGFSYDWSRQVKTSDPKFYKWTQWIFLKLFDSWYNREKNKAESIFTLYSFFAENGCQNWPQHDKAAHPEFTDVEWNNFTTEEKENILMHYRLAYQSYSEVNWCEALGTVLANDEVKDGKSERGGHPVERRKMRQWFLRITEYADRLLTGLDTLEWSEAMKDMQRNWIGRSEGALVRFPIVLTPSPSPKERGETANTVSPSPSEKDSAVPPLSFGEGSGVRTNDSYPRFMTGSNETSTKNLQHAKQHRKEPTEAEEKLWQEIRNEKLEFKFRRQHLIDKYIVDFVCLQKGLVIEVDGDIHDLTKEEDETRTAILSQLGFTVIRFTNDEVLKEKRKVLERIKAKATNLSERTSNPISSPPAPLRRRGEETASLSPFLSEGKDINSSPLLRRGAGGEDRTAGTITVFTTRPDTIFGATFMVIAPEHELVPTLTTPGQQKEIDDYIAYVKSRTDVERQQEKKVTGAFTGSYAVNPFTGMEIPIYIAEYVLAGYGTGAIMAVPADDERDRKFAEKFGLPIIEVIDKSAHPGAEIGDKVGTMINSGFLNGMEVKEAIKYIIDQMENGYILTPALSEGEGGGRSTLSFGEGRGEEKIGQRKVNYRLRDATYSRQRYWGEPFPIVYKNDIPYPLEADELPLVLPPVDSYKPSGDGRSPIANNKAWVHLPDGSERETDIMPGYAGSSWYFLRYMDPDNDLEFASKDKIDYWQSVDLYLGGSEHAVGHLLYARLWHKFLYDMGYVPTEEPFKKLVNQGMIQGVSAWIYRLSHSGNYPTNTEQSSIERQPQIFVSYEICKTLKPWKGKSFKELETQLETLPDDVKACISRLNNIIKKAQNIPTFRGSLDRLDFISRHVEVSVLEGDALNIEMFKTLPRLWTENSLFVYDSNGHITCERAVEKMSKSKYNTVNPDDVIEKYGADCFRMFEMFLGPLDQSKPWDDKGIDGVAKFIRRFWRLFYDEKGNWRVTDAVVSSPPALSEGEGANTASLLRREARSEDDKTDQPAVGSSPPALSEGEGANTAVPSPLLRRGAGGEDDKTDQPTIGSSPPALSEREGANTAVSSPLLRRGAGGEETATPAELKILHKTLKKVAEDIERLQFNTCVSQFMICLNELNELKCNKREILEPLLIALAPFTPFLTEELWQALGHTESIHKASYPTVEEKYLVESAFNYPVSINGKVRAEMPLALDLSEAEVRSAVLAHEAIQKWTNGAEPKKFIFVKGRIINVVV